MKSRDQAVAPVVLSRKAQLRRVALRHYARLQLHARNCTHCKSGPTDIDPPVIRPGCRVGAADLADYARVYQAWVDCPGEEDL